MVQLKNLRHIVPRGVNGAAKRMRQIVARGKGRDDTAKRIGDQIVAMAQPKDLATNGHKGRAMAQPRESATNVARACMGQQPTNESATKCSARDGAAESVA